MSVVIPVSLYRNKQGHLACQSTRVRGKVRVKRFDVIAALVGCLLGQAVILEGLAPFGVAYLAIFVNLQPHRLALIGLGVSVGTVLARGWTGLWMMGAVALGLYVMHRWERWFRHDVTRGALLACSIGLYNLVYNLLCRSDFYQYLMGILEPLLVFCLAWLFAEGLTGVALGTRQRLSRTDLIAVLFFASGVIVGIPLVELKGFELTPMVVNALILVLAYAGGIASAAVAGMFLGLILALTGFYPVSVIGLLGFAGLTSGFFREWGKATAILGLLLSTLVFAGLGIVDLSLVHILLECLIAGSLFFLIPDSLIAKLRHYLPGTGELLFQESEFQIEQQRKFVERLNEISQVFSELGSTFMEVSAVEDVEEEDEVSEFLSLISERICKGCEFAVHCWDRQFYQTYTQIFKLMTVLENQGQARGEDFVQLLKGHCRNLSRLKNTVDNSLEIYQLQRKWSRFLQRQQAMVGNQLGEVARIVASLSQELNLNTTRKEDMEQALKMRLESNGIKIAYCRFSSEAADDQLNICLGKERCLGDSECRRMFQIINQMIDQPLTNYEKQCGLETGQRLCHLKYSPARRYKVNLGVWGTAKEGNAISGDNYRTQQLKSGKFMTVLSDGMGTGEEAARESGAAVGLVQKILNAGFNHDAAIQWVNSALLSRSITDRFATIDLSFIDLFTGELELVKIGAEDTFIKRGDEVNPIRGGSLPAGIMDDLEPKIYKRRLEPDDYVILMTDGILDAVNTVNKEEWMIRLLRQCSCDTPGDLAQYIYTQAKGNAPATDDMTVLVIKLEEETKVH